MLTLIYAIFQDISPFQWTDGTPYAFGQWLTFPSPISSESSHLMSNITGAAKSWTATIKRTFETMQPNSMGDNNCTALYLWNTVTPFWVKIPCHMEIEEPLVLCEYGKNYSASGIPRHRSEWECSSGFFHTQMLNKPIRDVCVSFVYFEFTNVSYSNSGNIVDYVQTQLIGRKILTVKQVDEVGFYIPLIYGREDFIGIWFLNDLQEEPDSRRFCIIVTDVNVLAQFLNYKTDTEVLCQDPFPLKRNTAVLEHEVNQINNSTCLPGHFQCEDGTCILNTYQCDGISHCEDKADKNNCSVCHVSHVDETPTGGFCQEICQKPECFCSVHYFQCIGGGCVSWSRLCDHKQDCLDGSDEILCRRRYNPSDFIRTARNKEKIYQGIFHCNPTQTISVKMVNDLVPDCQHNQADEYWHDVTRLRVNFVNFASTRCWSSNLSSCGQGSFHCFPTTALCLFEKDTKLSMKHCRNGGHLLNCQKFHCPLHFKCPMSYCIELYSVCDGVFHCPNGEDEVNCKVKTCKGLLKCASQNTCVHPKNIVDGVIQCHKEMDDEQDHQIQSCPNYCLCKGHSVDCSLSAVSELQGFHHRVKFLNISGSRIPLTFNSFEGLRHLIGLDMSKKKLSSLPHGIFENLENLNLLFLQDNNLTHIENYYFHGLQNIWYLNIKQNPVVACDGQSFVEFRKLRNFDLSFLLLKRLQEYSFVKMTNCLSLNLSHNALIFIASGVFVGLNGLLVLDLRGNPIMRLHSHAFRSLLQIKVVEFPMGKFCCLVQSTVVCNPKVSMQNSFSSCHNFIRDTWVKTTMWALAPVIFLVNAASVMWHIRHTNSWFRLLLNLGQNFSDIMMSFALLCLLSVDISSVGIFVAEYESELPSHGTCVVASVLALLSFQVSFVFSFLLCSCRLIGARWPFYLKKIESVKGVFLLMLGCLLTSVVMSCLLDQADGFCSPFKAHTHCSLLIPAAKADISISYICFWAAHLFLVTIFISLNILLTATLLKRPKISSSQKRNTKSVISRVIAGMGSGSVGHIGLFSLVMATVASQQPSSTTVDMILILNPMLSIFNPVTYTFLSPNFIESIRNVRV